MRAAREVLARGVVAAAAVSSLIWATPSALGDRYIVTPLTSGLNGTARDISAMGLVCGVDAGRAFVWRPASPNATTGTLSMLPSLIAGFSSNAYGVNSSGLVVGHTGDDPLAQHEVPVVWLPNGSIIRLHLFNGVTSGGLASGINEAGEITGRNGLFTSDAAPVQWNSDGTGTYLGNPPGYSSAVGWKINEVGSIAGMGDPSDGASRVFIHANGEYTFLPLLQGATLSAAYDINDAGHVVGSSTFRGVTAFFYDGSMVQPLANVPGDLIQVSTALGINNHDQIVGYGNPTPNITGAVIWESPSATPQYLNALIDPSSPGYVSASNPGWIVTEAVAINDAGQIAARGLSTSGGSYKALLLTPVDGTTGVNPTTAPLALAVGPNPAHGPVRVQWTIPRAGHVRLRVMDIAGHNVVTLHDGFAGPGTTGIRWDSRFANGRKLTPGVYFLRLETSIGVASRRLVLIL